MIVPILETKLVWVLQLPEMTQPVMERAERRPGVFSPQAAAARCACGLSKPAVKPPVGSK